MPKSSGIDPSNNYTDINAGLSLEFSEKGRYGKVSFAEGRGLFVEKRRFETSTNQLVQADPFVKDKFQKMIDAGRQVEGRMRNAIDREFPEFTFGGRTLGGYALDEANAHKIDIWAYRERKRIEALAEDHFFDNADIDFPYHVSKQEIKFLLGDKLQPWEKEEIFRSALGPTWRSAIASSGNEEEQKELESDVKERILKNALSDTQKKAIASSYNEHDLNVIDSRVWDGIAWFSNNHPDLHIRQMAHDHLQIMKNSELSPHDAVARERAAKRHKVVEESRLLREAIANDLQGDMRFTGNAQEIAARVVSNLQQSPSVLTPDNLSIAAQFVENLGCNFSNVADVSLERALTASTEHARGLNVSIKTLCEEESLQAVANDISDTVNHSDEVLATVANAASTGRFKYDGLRNSLASRLIDSAVKLADARSHPALKSAVPGTPAYNLAERLEEQARIANELGQALLDPSLCGDLPSLKMATSSEVRRAVEENDGFRQRRVEGTRILSDAIRQDVESDRTFPGDAAAFAESIVAQLQSGRQTLSPANIVTVQGLLKSLNLPHGNVDGLTKLINLDRKLSANISQIRSFNTQIMRKLNSWTMMFDSSKVYFNQPNGHVINTSNAVLDRAEQFLKGGRLDDTDARNRLYEDLKNAMVDLGKTLEFLEQIRYNGGWSAFHENLMSLVKKQQAATYDLAAMVRPGGNNGSDYQHVNDVYPAAMRRRDRIERVDARDLAKRIETPHTLFRSDQSRWRARRLLTEPLRQYNAALDRVSHALEIYKQGLTQKRLEALLAEISNALILNNHVRGMFDAVNRFRAFGRNSQDQNDVPTLQAQQECLQRMQASAARMLCDENEKLEKHYTFAGRFVPLMETIRENDGAESELNAETELNIVSDVSDSYTDDSDNIGDAKVIEATGDGASRDVNIVTQKPV